MKILVTGFEPFAGSDVNPSERAATALTSTPIVGAEVEIALLPCVDGACERVLLDAVRQHTPDITIALGEHGRETGLGFERFALNLRDYRIPDNAGATVTDQPVIRGAPAGYFTKLPVHTLVERARRAGVPSRVSRDAGTFLCNQAYFALLHARAIGDIGCDGIFVHVPRLPEQAAASGKGQPSMVTETVVRGLRATMDALVGTSGA